MRPSKSPPKRPGRARALEELVQQIAVACFDVHELESDFLGQAGRRDVGVDQTLQVVVRPDDRIVARVNAELGVQQRMVIRDARLQLL